MNYFVPLQQIFEFGHKKQLTGLAITRRMGATGMCAADMAARQNRLGTYVRGDHSHL